MGSSKRVTDKQEAFVQALLRGESQRKAYREAYPGSRLWTDKAADEAACVLLKRPKVSQRYEELRSRLIKETEDVSIASAKEVLQRLTAISRANLADFGGLETAEVVVGYQDDENGNPDKSKPVVRTMQVLRFHDTAEVSREKMSALDTIAQTRDGIRVKLKDSVKATELLGKHYRLFDENVHHVHTGAEGGPIETKHTIKLEALSVEELKILAKLVEGDSGEPATNRKHKEGLVQ